LIHGKIDKLEQPKPPKMAVFNFLKPLDFMEGASFFSCHMILILIQFMVICCVGEEK